VSSALPDGEPVVAASERMGPVASGKGGGVGGRWRRLPRRWVPGPCGAWTPARARADNTGRGVTSGPGGARVGRRRSGPAGDGDDCAVGRPARVAALGAERRREMRN
jgi:hypothetical protein